MMATLFGVLFFRLNKGTKVPISTIISSALLGLLGFQFMPSKYWIIVFIFILTSFTLHFYRHRDSKFTIFPVISSIMGIFSRIIHVNEGHYFNVDLILLASQSFIVKDRVLLNSVSFFQLLQIEVLAGILSYINLALLKANLTHP